MFYCTWFSSATNPSSPHCCPVCLSVCFPSCLTYLVIVFKNLWWALGHFFLVFIFLHLLSRYFHPIFFHFYRFYFCMKGRVVHTYTHGERDRVFIGQSVLQMAAMARTSPGQSQDTETSSGSFPGTLWGSCIWNGASGAQIGTHMTCWHCRQQLHSLYLMVPVFLSLSQSCVTTI